MHNDVSDTVSSEQEPDFLGTYKKKRINPVYHYAFPFGMHNYVLGMYGLRFACPPPPTTVSSEQEPDFLFFCLFRLLLALLVEKK